MLWVAWVRSRTRPRIRTVAGRSGVSDAWKAFPKSSRTRPSSAAPMMENDPETKSLSPRMRDPRGT